MPRFEQASAGRFWEIEQDELIVRWASGAIDGSGTVKRGEATHPDEDAAYHAAALEIRRQRRHGFVWAGPSRVLAGGEPPSPPTSTILLDEYFAAGDPRFGVELRRCVSAARLATLAEPWYKDARPWARAALLAYVDDGCGRPFHRPLVKRLFKLAEAAADDEAMAHFLAAFDRLSHRLLLHGRTWNSATRAMEPTSHVVEDPSVPERLVHGQPSGKDRRRAAWPSPVFSRATRRYLARRAARYLRHLGYADVDRYRRIALLALSRYPDRALTSPARLLDAWGLTQILYGRSPVLERKPRGIRLGKDRTLAGLVPAPQFPAAWIGCYDQLWELLLAAPARTVRTWTIAWLRQQYPARLDQLELAEVTRLLLSPHADLRAFGAERLPQARGVETASIDVWLSLLAIHDLDVVPAICTAVEKYVAPTRLSLAQCVALAGARVAQVARLGLAWARGKSIATAELPLVAKLARAGVAEVRAAGTAWVLTLLRDRADAGSDAVRDLCDAPFADVRELALAAVTADERHAGAPALWFALTESPYDDVRAVVVRHAERWREQAAPSTLRHVWTSAVLAVHRGSRTKQRVPKAIAERVVAHPDEADALLPVLALALRSVRAPERATALAALARAVHRDPGLRARAAVHLPELTISGEVTS